MTAQKPLDALRVSVILCTHNPRLDYLEQCLRGLSSQSLPLHEWELVVVDNASTPPISSLLDATWASRARIVREEALGLTAARVRGISESRAGLLVFVDDDNVLDSDYLENALAIAGEKPFLGSWSGQCRPSFEVSPPSWTRRYWGNLAVREFSSDSWSNLATLGETMPCGAGLCVRRSVALYYLRLHESGKRAVKLDRTESSLLSGGDNDLAACACDVGLGLGLMSKLKLTHLIPRERLTLDYLTRLVEGIYFSSVILSHMRSWPGGRDSRVRWIDRIRALLRSPRHAAIQRAALRGRSRGLKFVAAIQRNAQ